jgi:hypothetical protein
MQVYEVGAESFPINETDDSDKTVLSSSSLGNDDGITVGSADGSSIVLTLGTIVGAVDGPTVRTVLGPTSLGDDDGITEGAADG